MTPDEIISRLSEQLAAERALRTIREVEIEGWARALRAAEKKLRDHGIPLPATAISESERCMGLAQDGSRCTLRKHHLEACSS